MKKGTLIGLVCGIVVTVIAIAGAVAATIFNMPSVKVARGMTKLFAQFAEQGEMFSDKLDFSKIQEIGKEGRYKNTVAFNMDIEGLDDYSVSVDGTVLCDNANEKMREEIKVSLAYYELFSIQLAVDKTDVYIDIPALYEGSVVFDSDNIGEQYNNSIFAGFSDEKIADDLSLDFFEYTDFDTRGAVKELLELIKNSEIKKTGSTVKAKVGNKEVTCQGYTLLFQKEDINRYLNILYTDAGEIYEVKKDMEFLIYMDRKDNIRQIETMNEIVAGDSVNDISVALRFAGEKNVFDAVKGRIGTEKNGNAIVTEFDYSAIKERDTYNQKLQCKTKSELTDLFAVNYDAVWDLKEAGYDMDIEVDVADESYKVEANGSVEADGYGFSMNFDDCEMYINHEKLADFDGSYSVEPLTEEISIPSGKTYPIFEFSQSEFYSFVMDVMQQLGDYYSIFDDFSDLF